MHYKKQEKVHIKLYFLLSCFIMGNDCSGKTVVVIKGMMWIPFSLNIYSFC